MPLFYSLILGIQNFPHWPRQETKITITNVVALLHLLIFIAKVVEHVPWLFFFHVYISIYPLRSAISCQSCCPKLGNNQDRMNPLLPSELASWNQNGRTGGRGSRSANALFLFSLTLAVPRGCSTIDGL